MVDTSKDNNLEIVSKQKELDTLIQKYKDDVQDHVQQITNLPHYNVLTTMIQLLIVMQLERQNYVQKNFPFVQIIKQMYKWVLVLEMI